MANVVVFVIGLAVVAFTLVDIGLTTISVSSARGPLSSRVMSASWRVFRTVSPHASGSATRLAGPLILALVLLTWLVGLTVGWAVVFSIDGALTSTGGETSGDDVSVRFVDALFFVFGSLVGRNSSSLSPDQAAWSSVEAAMALTGVGIITLALAWIIPVVQAVVHKRAVANQLSAIGGTPQEMLRNCWNGDDYGEMYLYFVSLVSELPLLAQRHLAFPVMHYFDTSDLRTAIGPRLAALDELLTIVEADELEDRRLFVSTITPLRRAISSYLDSLEQVFIVKSVDNPRPPAVAELRDDGLVTCSDERVAELCDELADRRRLLAGYLDHDGWSWSDVFSTADVPDDADPEQ